MRKRLLKTSLFLVTFFLSLFLISRIMNQGNNNMTMEMAPATLPVITMVQDDILYNELHGYLTEMNTALQRETVTGLGEDREFTFRILNYGQDIESLYMEVRSCDGSRLIENTELTELEDRGEYLECTAFLKDLIDRDTEYELIFRLTDENGRLVCYYTRVIWSDTMYAAEKLAYVRDFHERTFDKELAKELAIYMESNSQGDNSTLHRVDIHSSLAQVSWGQLEVREVTEPVFSLREIAAKTATLGAFCIVSTGSGRNTVYYLVEETYRIRYTTERTYLLSYDRTMTQIPDIGGEIYGNDKIELGIAGEDVSLVESEDGNIIVFQTAGKLCSYNVTTNKIAMIFSFYDQENADERALYQEHEIRILDVNEGGNVLFSVYGYMNRGRHEGCVGIQVANYDSTLNTVEEVVWIPCDKPYETLAADVERLLYLNRGGKLYLYLDHVIYELNVQERTYTEMAVMVDDDSLVISGNQKIIVWNQGDALQLMNLGTEKQVTIGIDAGERVVPLGFMGEDIIYGLAREEDTVTDVAGATMVPMYKVCIRNSEGEKLKEYCQENFYTVACQIEDNQITLERVTRLENGTYAGAAPEHIMNNEEQDEGKNRLVTVVVDVYERISQIQVKNTIDTHTIQVLTPREVEFEGSREVQLPLTARQEQYYVYNTTGVAGIYYDPSLAVQLAYDTGGSVMDDRGTTVWIRGNRVVRNQIMAIHEDRSDEERGSLAVCLDTILQFEGVSRNTQYMLDRGESVMEILQDNLGQVRVLDLKGCSLDAVLYFTNRDIPVLVTLEDGEAVLVVGFNQYNIVVMEPSTGRLYQKGMNDSAEWFEENGSHFITYMRLEE